MAHSFLGKLSTLIGALVSAAILLQSGSAQAANWQLVWADEFNGSISPDWTLTDSGGGFGNNELEYYLPRNATIENNMLVITAKQESYGGNSYTSAKLSTQGHRSWNKGKFVARIALPGFQGSWPAFWMLGDNIGSVGWPACGELDIMEQINTSGTIYGSTHWYSGGQADYSGNNGSQPTSAITSFHEYSVEWDANYIKWFIDGNQYNAFYIGGNAGGTGAFNSNSFFLILNLAVGGNWPGFTINNGALPAKMYVDYVRVYQDSPSPVGPAEYSYCAPENATCALPGVSDVAYGANGAFSYKYGVSGTITFNNVTFGDPIPGVVKAGFYKLSASPVGPAGYTYAAGENGSFSLPGVSDVAYGANGAFNYKYGVSGTITFDDATFGDPIFGVVKAGFYRPTTSGSITPAQVAASSYTYMSGVQTEACSEGGQDVGWIDAGDWMVYPINVPVAGNYTISYRVASLSGGGIITPNLDANATVLPTISVPATNGWQNWTTISQTVYLPAGAHNFGVYASAGGWNLEWIEFR
jgi:beta-glucanase (GH16 family)